MSKSKSLRIFETGRLALCSWCDNPIGRFGCEYNGEQLCMKCAANFKRGKKDMSWEKGYDAWKTTPPTEKEEELAKEMVICDCGNDLHAGDDYWVVDGVMYCEECVADRLLYTYHRIVVE